MVQNYSELYLAVPLPTPAHCRLPYPREGWTGDSDLKLCHLPVDLGSEKVVHRRIQLLMAAAILSR